MPPGHVLAASTNLLGPAREIYFYTPGSPGAQEVLRELNSDNLDGGSASRSSNTGSGAQSAEEHPVLRLSSPRSTSVVVWPGQLDGRSLLRGQADTSGSIFSSAWTIGSQSLFDGLIGILRSRYPVVQRPDSGASDAQDTAAGDGANPAQVAPPPAANPLPNPRGSGVGAGQPAVVNDQPPPPPLHPPPPPPPPHRVGVDGAVNVVPQQPAGAAGSVRDGRGVRNYLGQIGSRVRGMFQRNRGQNPRSPPRARTRLRRRQ